MPREVELLHFHIRAPVPQTHRHSFIASSTVLTICLELENLKQSEKHVCGEMADGQDEGVCVKDVGVWYGDQQGS